MRQKLKLKFIEILVKKGWNESAMREAAAECGKDENYHIILFPDGPSQALDYYEQWKDSEMLEDLAKLKRPAKIREKIALALNIRIIPNHIPALKSAWRTADLIWRYAGDTATDFNHYTKRALLSGVYITSSKYRAQNSEEGTRDYIIKALDKIISIASFKNKLPKLEDVPILRMFS